MDQEDESSSSSSSSSLVASDLPRRLQLNVEARQHAEEASDVVRKLSARVADGGDLSGAAGAGMSLLELKNLLMVDYLGDLAYLMLRKCAGRRVEGQAAVERLVANRTVLEKIRPIEQKLK